MGVALSEILNLWPARIVTPDHAYGDTNDRMRAFLYTREDGITRLVVIDGNGKILDKTDVAEHQFNGGGMDVTTTSGEQWQVVALPGCSTCGGGVSAGRAFELMRGQGDE